jgi:hypothetical protein
MWITFSSSLYSLRFLAFARFCGSVRIQMWEEKGKFMCGVLNATVERASDLATPDEIGKVCVHCGFPIDKGDTVHRYGDGEPVHLGCYNDLNDEDAHFYEPMPEEAA